MKHALRHIHFVGIGGAGMSGIAEILHAQGYTVSGSDQVASDTVARLQRLGLQVHVGHDAAHVVGAQAVVVSTAVSADNPERLAALAQGVPVVHRAVMLAELMRRQQGIAIAGTHGKTTTTGLVTQVLIEAGADPSFVIGGALQASVASPAQGGDAARAGLHSRLGRGDFIVVEADESDASFLHLLPVLSVVTNIDADHMDTYGHSVERLHTAFVDFLHRMPFYGAAIVCGDDPGVQAIRPRLERPVLSYGLSEGVDFRATAVRATAGGGMRFDAQRKGLPALEVELSLAGDHNVRNALAALAVAAELELPDAAVLRALATFGGMGRRFQRWGDLPARSGGRFTLIDDYGHHPVELAAVLAAARGAFAGRRVLLAFQPHRYTRTRDCLDRFVEVLAQADAVCLTEVYAAGEVPIAGADGRALVQALQRVQPEVRFVADVGDLPAALLEQARDGDVLITLGAGSIGAVAQRVVQLAGAIQEAGARP
jgi:UDP-N-acetylmuramate--alanine ligase